MREGQVSKKLLIIKKQMGDQAHWEGKYFCDCRVKNFRKWLAVKRYGKPQDKDD